MFDYIYEWIQNIAFYLVLVTAVLHAVPNHEYKKYIRFFTGLVLILMVLAPVLRLFGTTIPVEDLTRDLYREFETQASGKALEEADDIRMFEEQAEEGTERMPDIEVEEIQVDREK